MEESRNIHMVRNANIDDIPSLLIMAKKFFKAAKFDGIEYNEESTSKTIQHLIASHGGLLLVSDNNGVDGMIGALVYPMYFNAAHLTGQELFWWSEGGIGGIKLIAEMEKQAKELGAKTFSMIYLENITPKKLRDFYEKRGYKQSETHYMRIL